MAKELVDYQLAMTMNIVKASAHKVRSNLKIANFHFRFHLFSDFLVFNKDLYIKSYRMAFRTLRKP